MHIQRQIVKISINHQTTETPSKPCFAMFKASFVQIYFQQTQEKVEKSTRRSHFDAYMQGKNVKTRKNHQTIEMPSKPCFAVC